MNGIQSQALNHRLDAVPACLDWPLKKWPRPARLPEVREEADEGLTGGTTGLSPPRGLLPSEEAVQK
jgi:hypothetical protein